ncbi:hypothetical protein [Polaromonas sp. JS666]|uniref:hypothetical protein n=1 Tax=Polaromonas sp. (strain JS666 / ATCC BAA-500) TaxID=296591 RepID=UPI0000464790|nr:hypothetical protein [Polaromonas sp. JS666]ABE43580.1 hypothetical protein Bpro_1644 [Polaromonas sp. JS666]
MTGQATFPIFVFDGNDLSLFDSFNSLTTALEGVDVEEGVYTAYDSSGRVVFLQATGVARGRFTVEIGRVIVGPVSEAPDVADFGRRLRSYLQACGEDSRAGMTLEELVHACIKRTGYQGVAA